ncbi:MAG: peptidoglycan-binding protein [Clostridia bacterium]|nr:peptidoglycan-binding protein [Clostridia bacterium]
MTPNTIYYFKVVAIGKNGTKSEAYIASKKTLSTASSSIPASLLTVKYEFGMTDPAIQTIKKKMQSYGYYTKGADVSSKYNDIMVERIEHFQRNNGLKVTGKIDTAFLQKLYSGNVVKTNAYD